MLVDGALHFCTGAAEQKARNIKHNPHVVMTTGANALNSGFDVVVEGDAVRVTDDTTLRAAADRYASKYEGWNFEGRDGALHSDGSAALLFRVQAAKALGFAKGEPFGQTRWTF